MIQRHHKSLTANSMKVVFIVSTLLVIVASQEARNRPPSVTILGGTARASGYESLVNEDADSNYEFSYEVQDVETGNNFGHKSSRQGKVATGYYHIVLPDGRLQTVEYVADENGYKPNVKFEGQPSRSSPAYKLDVSAPKN